jgi:hypothetical protein
VSVSTSWLAKVNVSITTTVIQPQSFNNCMIIGVFNTAPASWIPFSSYTHTYTDLITIQTDFAPVLSNVVAAGDTHQANNLQHFLDTCSAFFSQRLTPNILQVGRIPIQFANVNYSLAMQNIINANNDFYGFTICDMILENKYSRCIVQVTTTSAVLLKAGVQLLGDTTTTDPYFLAQDFYIPVAGIFEVPFFSRDGLTAIAAHNFTGLVGFYPAVSVVDNAVAATNNLSGIMTPTTGLTTMMAGLRADNNLKYLFLPSNDPVVAREVQTDFGGSNSILILEHSQHFQFYSAVTRPSIHGAFLAEYFTDLFKTGIGLKCLSSTQLKGQPTDPLVTTTTIGQPDTTSGYANLTGWNNNIYALFGTSLALLQYGHATSSTPTTRIYLDQVVGADYLQVVTQADLTNLLVTSQITGSLPFSDTGIQQILSTVKSSAQKLVDLQVIQPFQNSDFVYKTYREVSLADITNRIYQDLTFNATFLSRIHRVALNVNLGL